MMARRSSGSTRTKKKTAPPARNAHQKGKQQGSSTGKDAWKSNQEHVDTQPGPGQVGQRPHKGEEWGSTPGEVRGHPGGKRGQAKSGQRGTKNSKNAKSAAKKAAKKAAR